MADTELHSIKTSLRAVLGRVSLNESNVVMFLKMYLKICLSNLMMLGTKTIRLS